MTTHRRRATAAELDAAQLTAAGEPRCPATWPGLAGPYTCELAAGHGGETHERITSSDWLSWCDDHAHRIAADVPCHKLGCDLRARQRDAAR